MGIARYYYNRYMCKEAFLYKIIIALSTIAVCLPFYIRYNIKYIEGGCAKDAILVLSQRFTFPLLMLICVFLCLRLALKDNNQNIVLRYKSKQKLWTYKSVAGILYFFESALIIYGSATLFGLAFFGKYDNWKVPGSKFYMDVTKHKFPLDIGMSDFSLFLLSIACKTIIISIVYSISILIEEILNEEKLMLIVAALLCGIDLIRYKGIMGMFNMLLWDYYSVNTCIRKLLYAIMVNMAIFLLGLIVSKYREYYKKKHS